MGGVWGVGSVVCMVFLQRTDRQTSHNKSHITTINDRHICTLYLRIVTSLHVSAYMFFLPREFVGTLVIAQEGAMLFCHNCATVVSEIIFVNWPWICLCVCVQCRWCLCGVYMRGVCGRYVCVCTCVCVCDCVCVCVCACVCLPAAKKWLKGLNRKNRN